MTLPYALTIARAHLERGHFEPHGHHFHMVLPRRGAARAPSRRFNFGTINQLIDSGEAVRIGNCVVKRRGTK
jgi:hypothetical protein